LHTNFQITHFNSLVVHVKLAMPPTWRGGLAPSLVTSRHLVRINMR